jgi:type II secretory pathway component GspD/PulD (secretin)
MMNQCPLIDRATLKRMKAKLSLLLLVGWTAGSWSGSAQTNPPTGATAAPPPAVVSTNDAAAAATTPATPPKEPLTAESAAPASGTNSLSASDNTPVDPGAVIPLIVMDDVPLTDAIRNLARQARLNYMLDPKIGFGQVGPDGKPGPQPMVSIRWENITAQQALMALLNNYNLDLVEDPKTHIARVAMKDPAAPPPLSTKIYQLKYSSPSNILDSIRSVLTDDKKRSKVMPDVRTSQLVVVATENELTAVDELVDRLDTQTKQVLIEARLVETSINPSTMKGMDWSGTLQGQNLAFGNNLQAASQGSINRPLATSWPKMMFDTSSGFNPATAFLDADGVNLVFSFLNQNAEAKVLSAPRAVMLDNETAMISVTRASPIINVTPGTANTTGGSTIQYTNLGVILNVTPRISANNYVNLKVTPEVSRKFDTVRKIVADGVYEADEYDVRKIDTRVMIPSGNTLVLGGLAQDDVEEINSKVPLLGDIPGLGYLFRHDNKARKKTNLLIFITPTIVRDEDFQPTKTDFLKNVAPKKDEVEPDWSAWDTGKPKDWSKKKKDETKATEGQGGTSSGPQFAPVP